MERITPPCYKCDMRTPECHGTCEGYKEYKQKVKSINDVRRETHKKSEDLYSFKYTNLNKNLRRHRGSK